MGDVMGGLWVVEQDWVWRVAGGVLVGEEVCWWCFPRPSLSCYWKMRGVRKEAQVTQPGVMNMI